MQMPVHGHGPQAVPAPDPLSDALECLALRSWVPGRLELSAPWGIQVRTRLGWFYLVSGHPCLVELEDGHSRVSVAPGDLVLVPPRRGHRLRDRGESEIVPIQSLLRPAHFRDQERLAHGGGGATTSLFCGCFLLNGLDGTPLDAALPSILHVRGDGQRPQPYIDHILRLIAQEAASKSPGAPMIINRVVRILLIKVLQGYMARLPRGDATWLRALTDADVGRVLRLMHGRPEDPWTVASLAAQIAMSRSAFAARFTATVGKPPLEYLTDWRIQKACYYLRTTQSELKEVAARVGYESAAAFSKAFARKMGVPPGAYRRAEAANAFANGAPCPPL